jgi:hypothetical protein
MITGSDVITAALTDFGEVATVNGGPASLQVVFDSDSQGRLSGDGVEHAGPIGLASMAEVVTVGLMAGNDGDVLTIGGVDYTVLAIDPDGLGGATLLLGGA